MMHKLTEAQEHTLEVFEDLARQSIEPHDRMIHLRRCRPAVRQLLRILTTVTFPELHLVSVPDGQVELALVEKHPFVGQVLEMLKGRGKINESDFAKDVLQLIALIRQGPQTASRPAPKPSPPPAAPFDPGSFTTRSAGCFVCGVLTHAAPGQDLPKSSVHAACLERLHRDAVKEAEYQIACRMQDMIYQDMTNQEDSLFKPPYSRRVLKKMFASQWERDAGGGFRDIRHIPFKWP